MLQKRDEAASSKCVGEEMSALSRLRGFRPGTALITLTAGEVQTGPKKDDGRWILKIYCFQ